MALVLAVGAGLLIGLSLGALGGGGSILAVPVLVYALGQRAGQATTASLVVVGVTLVIGVLAAHRAGTVLLGRGVAFGAVATGGAVAGAKAAAHVSGAVLLTAFALLMLVVAALMTTRELRNRPGTETTSTAPRRVDTQDPVIRFRPSFSCSCGRALQVLGTATVVGLLTGFFGVGGGFLVVPALVLVLRMPMRYAVGTSLVVITLTSATAFAVRAGVGVSPDWTPVLVLTAVAGVGAVLGARFANRVDAHTLSVAFTVLVLGVALFTAARAWPALG